MRVSFLLLVCVSALVIPEISIAGEEYSYLAYFAYPEKALRGYMIEQLPSGRLQLEQFRRPLAISGVPVSSYVFTSPATPNKGGLTILGLEEDGFRRLYGGELQFDEIAEIEVLRVGNTAVYGGTNISGGYTMRRGPIINSVLRKGNQESVQSNRLGGLGGPVIKSVSKFFQFEASYRNQPPNELVHAMSWDSTLVGQATESQLIFRELSPETGAGKGDSVPYTYDPKSHLGGLSFTNRFTAGDSSEWDGIYRGQDGVGTSNTTSAVFLFKLRSVQFFSGEKIQSSAVGIVPGSIKRVSPRVKTGNTNGELFQSVAIHPTGDYIAYTQWLPACKKLGLFLRQRNPDGSFKPPRNLENCASLKSSTIGVIGLSITETYQTD